MSKDRTEPLEEIAGLVSEAWRGASILSASPLAGDSSSRRYLRLRLTRPAPDTCVAMIQSDSGLSISSDELAVFTEAPREMPFLNVQRWLRSVAIAVPEVYAADEGRGLVLLEDLGDVTLWEEASGGTRDRALALFRAAIDQLVALQIAGAESRDAGCIAFQQTFDARLFLWEFDHFLEYGLTGRPAQPADVKAMRAEFEALAERLGSEPLVLTHRDYHGWNLFVQSGRIRVIDFQDALLAPVPYDLATLLNDRATPQVVTPPLERALIDHFLARRKGGEDPESFRRRYCLFVFQKALKVLGRFVFLEDVKGKRGYRAMLPDTIATTRRSLENLPELRRLRGLLARSFPELR